MFCFVQRSTVIMLFDGCFSLSSQSDAVTPMLNVACYVSLCAYGLHA